MRRDGSQQGESSRGRGCDTEGSVANSAHLGGRGGEQTHVQGSQLPGRGVVVVEEVGQVLGVKGMEGFEGEEEDLVGDAGLETRSISLITMNALKHLSSYLYVPQPYIAVSFNKCTLCKSFWIKAPAKCPKCKCKCNFLFSRFCPFDRQ